MCGCDKERAEQIMTAVERNPGALAGAFIEEPQGNYEDYFLQDYDVKPVEQLPMEELEPYDFTGPKISGIGEMIADSETDSSEVISNNVTIYLAPMYNSEAIKTFECISPISQALVLSELDSHGISDGKLETHLSKMYKVYNKNSASTDKDKIYLEVAKKSVKNGWVMQAGITGVAGQLDAHVRLVTALKTALEAKGYNVLIAGNGTTDATSNKERAIAARDNAASCFICVGTRKSDTNGGFYCMVPSPDIVGDSVASDSYILAEEIIAKLDMADNSTNIPKNSSHDTPLVYAEHTILNWTEVPTVWIQFGCINNSSDKRNLQVGETTYSFANAVADAIITKYPIGGN